MTDEEEDARAEALVAEGSSGPGCVVVFAAWTVIIAAIAVGFYDFALQDAVIVGLQGALGIVCGLPLVFVALFLFIFFIGGALAACCAWLGGGN